MVNIVFIDVNKLNINFKYQESDKISQKLNQLKENILRLVGSEKTLIVFVSKDKIDAVKYDAALLINYFNAITLNMDNVVIGDLLTSDAVANLCISDDANIHLNDSKKSVENKQLDEILTVGKDNISRVVHITDGVEYFFLRSIADLDNISMYTGYDYPGSNIDYDPKAMPKTVYLISKEPGIDGFNDCFETYFAHEKEHPVRSKKKPGNNQ